MALDVEDIKIGIHSILNIVAQLLTKEQIIKRCPVFKIFCAYLCKGRMNTEG
jgi:hypothetical protein